ncbi:Ff.00g050530.m01.CDS01 [Fusarium sp. VM40]|nr:Ff.00g050530.m01.CDS01 [Fusarium sp. VM40]
MTINTVDHSGEPEPDLTGNNTNTINANANATTQDEIITPAPAPAPSPAPSILTHSSSSGAPPASPATSIHSEGSSIWTIAWSDEMQKPSSSQRCATRWVPRVLPPVMLALVGYATYDVIVYCCAEYLVKQERKVAAAVVLIAFYAIFFILMTASYLRCFLTIQFNAGFVPWTADREAVEQARNERLSNGGDVESLSWAPPDTNPDSPGLEAFYSKDVFICESDGMPKWCSECRSWKPDRAHHSSEYGRCVYKMDHVCPWMGGIISETSFNFFVQFTVYCACYCAVVLGANGYVFVLRQQNGLSGDARLIVGLALGGLFGLFAVTMASTALRFAFQNITNIDLFRKNQTFRLAVWVPNNTQPTERFATITYPLTLPGEPPRTPIPARFRSVDQSDGAASVTDRMAARDEQAKRTFAILQTEPGENPWHIGYRKNFTSVMGDSVIEWLLPIRHSPCTRHDNMVSDYEFGPLVEELKRRYGLVGGDPEKEATETTSN